MCVCLTPPCSLMTNLLCPNPTCQLRAHRYQPQGTCLINDLSLYCLNPTCSVRTFLCTVLTIPTPLWLDSVLSKPNLLLFDLSLDYLTPTCSLMTCLCIYCLSPTCCLTLDYPADFTSFIFGILLGFSCMYEEGGIHLNNKGLVGDRYYASMLL